MDAWMWWLIAVGVFGIAGVLTSVVEFGMFAVGGLAGAAVAGTPADMPWQFAAFAAVSTAMLVFVRPLIVKPRAAATRVGVAALVGTSAVVLERVDENGGRIKLDGEVWSARALDSNAVFEVGERVDVAAIDGATALVM